MSAICHCFYCFLLWFYIQYQHNNQHIQGQWRQKTQHIPREFSADWLEKLDGRTNIARAVNVRLRELETDLGGRENLSYQQRALCKRAIWTEAVIEQREAALARGEEIDLGQLIQANNGLIGLLKALGLERRTKNVPDLQTYLKTREVSA